MLSDLARPPIYMGPEAPFVSLNSNPELQHFALKDVHAKPSPMWLAEMITSLAEPALLKTLPVEANLRSTPDETWEALDR